MGDPLTPEMTPRDSTLVIAGIFTLLLASLLPTALAQSDILVYTPTPPPEIADMNFPEKWSHFDSSGTLWAFWRVDDTVYYTDAADSATWDITTSYSDFYTLPHSLPATTAYKGPLAAQRLLANFALASAFGALTIYIYIRVRARKNPFIEKWG